MGQDDLPKFCDLAHKIFRQKWHFIDFDVLNLMRRAYHPQEWPEFRSLRESGGEPRVQQGYPVGKRSISIHF